MEAIPTVRNIGPHNPAKAGQGNLQISLEEAAEE